MLLTFIAFIASIALPDTTDALSLGLLSRRTILGSPIPILSFITDPPRIQETGRGSDIFVSDASDDALFPISMAGRWVTTREVLKAEGDLTQAEVAWRSLGGAGEFRKETEVFETRFIDPPAATKGKASYSVDGEPVVGVVQDRGAEMSSRLAGLAGSSVTFDAEKFNHIAYTRNGNSEPVEIDVIQRQVTLPNEQGWGYTELCRVTEKTNILGASGKLYRAFRIVRKYRRGYNENGERSVEGIESVKTYRVLDGVAGALPTSTTITRLQLSRPKQ